MMKNNKLHTVNRWNKKAFTPERGNLFLGGGEIGALDFKNAFGSKGLKAAGEGLVGGLAGGLGSAVGGLANKAISGGLSSGAGSAISNIGGLAAGAIGSVNPLLGAAVGVGTQLIGGLTNRAFGMKTDQEKLNDAKASIKNLSSFNGNLGSLDEIQGPSALASADGTFKGGWFSSGKARRKQEELDRSLQSAQQFAQRSVENNVENLLSDQLNDALANYSAFGGPLDMMDNNDNMGAIGYGFMSDYLTQKKRENDTKSRGSGIVSMPAFMSNNFAIGGDLQTNGGDFSSGLTRINAGLSHEENPNEGVQMGVDNEGIPNFVEEGETIYNDYVFSNRILADATTKQMFKLPKKRDITFADISKGLEKEIAERPNDPISKAGFKKQMQILEEQQERQKQEMEAERAKAAFEALSPEEQTALMQQKAEQEAMAQQQATASAGMTSQPTEEESTMAQQQQMMADGSQPNLGQEPEIAANGGKLFAPGGYLWDKFWEPVNEYSKKKGNAKNRYAIDKTYKGDIKELEGSEAYKAFTDYMLNKATDDERMKYFRWIDANTGRQNKYITDGRLVDNWKDMYQSARTDGLYGIQHYTPEWQAAAEAGESVGNTPEGRIFHAIEGDEDYIQGEMADNVGPEVRRAILPNGDTVIYHEGDPAALHADPNIAAQATIDANVGEDAVPVDDRKKLVPVHKAEWPRYAGLFGPAIGLGLMAAGVGRPNTRQLDAVIEGAGDVALADYKPLGNYLTYRPMDIWYEQNRLNANARATDRAIMNSGVNQGSKMAGLLAAGYNDQIASGNLYRQALEYNDNKRKEVAEFNRGTDQFNADAYNRTSQFNANALNQGRQHNSSLALQAAQQKMNADAGWYNGIYGNVSGLFRGISDLGRENTEANWRNALATAGAFGVMDEDALVRAGYAKRKKNGKGGKIKRGLTY